MATGSSPASVKAVNNDDEFKNELLAAGNKLLVVDCFSTNCGPCKLIAPVFASLSTKYSSAIFVKLDVAMCRNTARRYEVNSTPTFLFFKKREKIHVMRGADGAALEAAIVQHLEPGAETAASSLSIPGQINLHSLVDTKGSECLNDSDDHPLSHALNTPTSKEFLESDCDEQLIIAIAFVQPVKLHSIQLSAPPDGRAPKHLKVFINQPQTLDFDQAEQYKPVQEFSLTPEDMLDDTAIALQYVKYQNVQSITLFVRDNQGGEETTVIHHLAFFGSPLDATKMSEFKRVAGEKGEKHS